LPFSVSWGHAPAEATQARWMAMSPEAVRARTMI
jgi:hypothetical protein